MVSQNRLRTGRKTLIYGPMSAYAVFETAIGWAGVAWAENGLIGAYLPEPDPAMARASSGRRFPGAIEGEPPPAIASVIDRIIRLMRGEKVDLSDAPLDIARVPAFNARVYEITRRIPAGDTLTYGDIALQLGDKLLSQQVGAALGRNPWPIIVPCHRVTAANGKLGGFTARGGTDTKLKLLAIEGASAAAQRDLFG
jgi:methylated-DNA-[protein]-cysteine S-methyltransferase